MKYFKLETRSQLTVWEIDGSKESIQSIPDMASEISQKEYQKYQSEYDPISISEKVRK